MFLTLLTCKEALVRLNDYLDRELTPVEMKRVSTHLKICHQCASKFSFEANFNRDFRDKVQRIDLSPELASRISQSLREENEASP